MNDDPGSHIGLTLGLPQIQVTTNGAIDYLNVTKCANYKQKLCPKHNTIGTQSGKHYWARNSLEISSCQINKLAHRPQMVQFSW